MIPDRSSRRKDFWSSLALVRFLSTVTLVSLMLSGCVSVPGMHVPGMAAPKTTPKGFEDARSTRAQLEANMAPRRWAVVVGVNRYDDATFTPLQFAQDDARDIAWAFGHERFGAFDRVISLSTPEQTTRAGILAELARLRNDLRRQDTLVLYFSGHGSMEFSSEGNPLLYLITRDTRAADLWGTAIELSALRAFLTGLKAQRKVMILDNCFSGSGKSRISSTTRQRLETTQAVWDGLSMTMGQSEAILMASTLGGVALEDDNLKHSTYTFALLKALTEERERADANLDGAVTAYEAHDYARRITLERTKRSQVPEGYFRVIGQAETFLSGTPRAAAAREAALVYAYGPTRHNGMTIEIDGRAKGDFPGTFAIEPGKRQITLKDEKGSVVASNTLELAMGQDWSVGMLLDALQGPRRFFALSAGGFVQPAGAAQSLWGAGGPRLEASSGYRVRGGVLRGLSMSFHFGWSPGIEPILGTDELMTSDGSMSRQMFELGGTVLMRRNLGKLQLGAGWFGEAVYVSSAVPQSTSTRQATAAGETTAPPETQPWLLLPGGPALWLGYPLDRHLLMTLTARGALVEGNYTTDTSPALNFTPSIIAGLELGF